MLRSYFKTAVRRLSKDKLYSLVNTIGLTIGISACLLIWLMAHYELSFDRFHPDRDRTYRAVSQRIFPGMSDWQTLGNISFGATHAIQRFYPGLDQIASFYSYNVSVTVPPAAAGAVLATPNTPVKYEPGEAWDMIVTEPAWFSIFQYKWLTGSPATALNEPFRVVLAASKARKYFGSIPYSQMIGKKLVYDDSLALTVTGVVDDWQQHTDLIFKDFISFSTIGVSFLRQHVGFDDPGKPDSWGERTYAQTYIKLKKGVSPGTFDPFIANIVKNRPAGREPANKLVIRLQPLADLHFDARYDDFYTRKTHKPTLYILIGTALFILFLAVINFINLSTAQAFSRAREVGTRKVLGSGRSGIIHQFLTETALLIAAAVTLSPLILWWVFRAFPEFIPPGLAYTELWSPTTILFLGGTAILTLLLAGLYPAFVLSGLSPALSLKGKVTELGIRRPYLRQCLTVFQFGIALFFIVATLIVGRQLHYMLHKDLGFRQDNIVDIDLQHINPNLPYTGDDIDRFAALLRRLPGVEVLSLNAFTIAQKGQRGFNLKDLASGTQLAMATRIGDEHYVPLFGLKIIAGRNIQVPKVDTETEILLSETAARQFGYTRPEDAIGHRMVAGRWTGPVVGIIADFYSQSLQDPLSPVFIMAWTLPPWNVSVRWRTTGYSKRIDPNTLAAMQKAFKEVYPTEDFQYDIFKEEVAGFYEEEHRLSTIINVAMIIMILISCMGLFGLAAFSTGQRTKEIGIRKVLGATIPGIIALLARQFLTLVVIAFLIASPVAWYFLNHWLLDYANRISIEWWEFAFAGIGAIVVALLTIGYHSVRAALVNPVESLRSD
jgi:putative ABC transport system permease protein